MEGGKPVSLQKRHVRAFMEKKPGTLGVHWPYYITSKGNVVFAGVNGFHGDVLKALDSPDMVHQGELTRRQAGDRVEIGHRMSRPLRGRDLSHVEAGTKLAEVEGLLEEIHGEMIFKPKNEE